MIVLTWKQIRNWFVAPLATLGVLWAVLAWAQPAPNNCGANMMCRIRTLVVSGTSTFTGAATFAGLITSTVAANSDAIQLTGVNADIYSDGTQVSTHGGLKVAGDYTGGGAVISVTASGGFRSSGATSGELQGFPNDGASAVGTILNAGTSLANATAKITSFQNATTEKAYIQQEGVFGSASTKARGTITLSGGTGTATVVSGAICVCVETSNATAGKCSVSGTTLTAAYGAGTDVIAYWCSL